MNAFDAPELMRIQTIVSAYSSVFTPDDAVGFPQSLPEARKIGLGRRSLTGFLTSGQKVDGFGPFESALERDYFVLLEFDPRVIAWHPQPVKVKVPPSEGRRARRYTPDVAVEYSEGSGNASLHHVELCEIKYRAELRENWTELKPALKAARAYATSQGWKFGIYTEVEIRTPRLKNAKFFLPYANRGTDDEDIYRLAMELRELGESTPEKLIGILDVEDRPRMLSVLWHMVAKGYVDLDLEREVTMRSLIRLNERAPI